MVGLLVWSLLSVGVGAAIVLAPAAIDLWRKG
jgi:hypothetical protein